MSSVFKKLITKELGEERYNKYFFCYQKLIIEKKYDSTKLSNQEIYDDMCDALKNKEPRELEKMMERLLECMHLALRINKQYGFIVLAYLIALVVLIAQGFLWWIMLSSISVITAAFLYKTWEFIVNKYCFIDAHIILVYKSVLDKLIFSHAKQDKE